MACFLIRYSLINQQYYLNYKSLSRHLWQGFGCDMLVFVNPIEVRSVPSLKGLRTFF